MTADTHRIRQLEAELQRLREERCVMLGHIAWLTEVASGERPSTRRRREVGRILSRMRERLGRSRGRTSPG